MAEQITPEVADRSEYEQVPTSAGPLKVAGNDHDAVATYAKQHENASGKLVTTYLHIICHLGIFVLARRLEDQPNTESDSHGIDPNVPAEIADHLAELNSTKGQGGEITSAGVPVDTTAKVLPVAAPVAEFPPSPAPEDAPAAPPPSHEPPAGTPLTAEEREAAGLPPLPASPIGGSSGAGGAATDPSKADDTNSHA